MSLGTDAEKKAFLDRLWELYIESQKNAPVRYSDALPWPEIDDPDRFFVKAWLKPEQSLHTVIRYILKMFTNRLLIHGLDPKQWTFDVVGDFEGWDEATMNEWLSVRHVPIGMVGKDVVWIHPRTFPSLVIGSNEPLEIDLDTVTQKLPWLNAYIYLNKERDT